MIRLWTLLLIGLLASCERPIIIAPDATLPDGAKYSGDVRDQLFHGQGELVFPDGAYYKGGFEAGLMHGQGLFVDAFGDRYEGVFKQGRATGEFAVALEEGAVNYRGGLRDWRFHGEGELDSAESRYRGGFSSGKFHGEGELVLLSEGNEIATYRGAFADGDMHGEGRYEYAGNSFEGRFIAGDFKSGESISASGDRYKGNFSGWSLTGEGEKIDASGYVYSGVFESGYLQGEGRRVGDDGSTYVGEFRYGRMHGAGVLESTSDDGSKMRQEGYWRRGHYIGPDKNAKRQSEIALENYSGFVSNFEKKLLESRSDETDVFLLAVAGDGTQSVFRREVEFVRDVLSKKFRTSGRELLLVNSHSTADSYPLATRATIRAAMEAIAELIDPANDLLIVYLTSHGSEDAVLSLDHDDIELSSLAAAELAEALALSSVPKLVMISACYSGSFLPYLSNPATAVLTASDAESQSFGCSDESEGTYFGRALFLETLQKDPALSIDEAFTAASAIIAEWEQEQGFEPSDPQMHFPKVVADKLLEVDRALSSN